MDVSIITELVGTLGFPIACVFVLFKQNSELQKTLNELSSTLVSMNERLGKLEEAKGE